MMVGGQGHGNGCGTVRWCECVRQGRGKWWSGGLNSVGGGTVGQASARARAELITTAGPAVVAPPTAPRCSQKGRRAGRPEKARPPRHR